MKREAKVTVCGLAFLMLAALTLAGSLRAQGNFVYTNDNVGGPNTVTGFSVAANGALTPVPGSPFATGGTGNAVCCLNRPTVDNVGNFLFASNTASNDVSVFTIDAATGTLSLVAGSPFPTGGTGDFFGIALSPTPDGRFLMAANSGSNNLTVFSVAASGALTPIPGSPFPTLSTPFGIKVSPDGKFLAVAQRFGGITQEGQVEMFSIAANGALTSLGGFPPTGGQGELTGVDFDCTTSLLYGGGPNGPGTMVDAYSIAAGGTLTSVPGSPFILRTLAFPNSDNNVVLLSPDNKTLFVTNQFQNSITVFSVASGGTLSLVTGSPFPNAGFIPSGMATSKDGSFLYVANGGNSVGVYSVASTGEPTAVPGSPFLTGFQTGRLLSLTAFPPRTCSAPAPTITSISPTTAIAGEAAFTLTVNGTNFVSGSTVNFAGNALATTFGSATQLTANVPASDIAVAGNFDVTVTNPGGGTSNAVSFTVESPEQAIQAIIDAVNALFAQGVLNGGQDNSLVVKLQHAIDMINAGNINGAIGILSGFIGEVNDLASSGVLTPDQAAPLTSAAQNVIATLP